MTFRCAQVIFTDQGGHRRSIASTSPRRLSHRYKFEVESDGRLYANLLSRRADAQAVGRIVNSGIGTAGSSNGHPRPCTRVGVPG